jgi:hypothetical protein
MRHKPRLSLSKAQVRAGIGAELLALCQSATSDGTLSKEEIVALRRWLSDHCTADLPAVAFLATTVERIVADRKVTREERDELQAAIETFLPPEARRVAAASRASLEAAQRHRERAERDANRDAERAERERNRPVAAANFMVRGVHYEGRATVIAAHAREGDRAFLARDPENRFSPYAVEVRLGNGMQIGFVPEEDASALALPLDQGYPHVATITKILTGGRVPIPVVQAYIYRRDALVGAAVFPSGVPAKTTPTGCLTVVLGIALAVWLAH